MPQSQLIDRYDSHLIQDLKAPKDSSGDAALQRNDLALCFVCLRWANGDADCRQQYRCEEPPFHGPKLPS
jgi:hypothetical protein